MKFLALTVIIAGACALPLRAQPPHANADEAKALRKAGALAWAMSEAHHDYSNKRIARRITPEASQRLAHATADKLAGKRNELARVLPALTGDTRFAIDLARFLERWPDRDALLQDLLLPSDRETLPSDISQLAMQTTDTRRGWKTLFPFFRP